MNCDHCQRQIGEMLDSDAGFDPALERHLESCRACRDFRDTLAALEVQLIAVPCPSLPADFKAALLAAIPAGPERLLPGEIAELRTQLVREHQEAVRALRRQYLLADPQTLLRFLAIACWVFLAGAALLGLRDLVGSAGTVLNEMSRWWVVPLLGGSLGAAALLFGLQRARRALPRVRALQWITR